MTEMHYCCMVGEDWTQDGTEGMLALPRYISTAELCQ